MKTRVMLTMSVIIVSSILIIVSCKKQITGADAKLNGIYIVPLSGSSAVENQVLVYSTTPNTYALGTAISSPLTADANVTIAVDNSLVSTYNSAQNTKYAIMPTGSYSLAATSLTIPKNSIASNQTNLIIQSSMLSPDVSYLLPVKVASVSASGITLNSAIATKYYIIRSPTPVIANLSDGKNSYWKNPSASYNPFRGNDGNTDGDWAHGSVCESGAGTEQYWEVDLGAVSPRIDTVRIWNRTDCCDTRTAQFYVFISSVPFTGTSVAATLAQPGVYQYYQDAPAGRPTLILPRIPGRYIRLQNTTTMSLTLAELTAIGIKP
jgi:hypothetical protein